MNFARAIRIFSGGLTPIALLFAAYNVWLAIDDYQMQIRNQWTYRCYDMIDIAIFMACCSLIIATISAFAYKKSTARVRRLRGTPQV